MKNSFEYLEQKCKRIFIIKVAKISTTIIGVFVLIFIGYELLNLRKEEPKKVVIMDDSPNDNSTKNDDLIVADNKFLVNSMFKETNEVIRGVVDKKDDEPPIELKTNINLEDIEKNYKEKDDEISKKRENDIAKKRILNKDIPPPSETIITSNSNTNNNNENMQINNNSNENYNATHVKFEIKEYKGINDLKEKYTKSPSYDLAIKLANTYLENSDYQNSVEWALKASRLNPNTIDPWIVYAKSKYNIGQKDRAIKVLELLNEKQNSKIVERLLASFKNDGI